MVDQLGFFEGGPPHFTRARRKDGAGSHDAAAKIERSGRALSDAQRVLAAVRRWPGSTSMELAKNAHIDRYICGKRLPELASEAVHLVRKVAFSTDAEPTLNTTRCAISNVRAFRWWPI
jgi:hypothetical protein